MKPDEDKKGKIKYFGINLPHSKKTTKSFSDRSQEEMENIFPKQCQDKSIKQFGHGVAASACMIKIKIIESF